MNAARDPNDPFARWWNDVFMPDVIRPLQRDLRTRATFSLVQVYTGIKPTAVRQWAGAHKVPAMPQPWQIHKLCVGFELDDDQRDELWSAWVSAARYRCETGQIKKATIGCMERR